MTQRNVYFKRNALLLFVLNAMPVIILGGLCSMYLFKYGREICMMVDFLFLMIALVKGSLALLGNNRVLVFANNNMSLCTVTKSAPKVIKRWVYDEIQFFYTDEKATKISVEFTTGKKMALLDFSNCPMLGKEAFFLAKAELCRYYPNKVKNLRDANVDSYIQSGTVPEAIKRQNEAGITGANVLAMLELILGFIPLGFGIWNAYLATAKAGAEVSGGIFDFLNVIGK